MKPDQLITTDTIIKIEKRRVNRHRRSREEYVSPLSLASELQEDLISQGGALGGIVEVPIDDQVFECFADGMASVIAKLAPPYQGDAFDTIADAVARLP